MHRWENVGHFENWGPKSKIRQNIGIKIVFNLLFIRPILTLTFSSLCRRVVERTSYGNSKCSKQNWRRTNSFKCIYYKWSTWLSISLLQKRCTPLLHYFYIYELIYTLPLWASFTHIHQIMLHGRYLCKGI